MRVAELMQQPVVTVELDTPVREAVVALADDHISAVPVIDRLLPGHRYSWSPAARTSLAARLAA